MMSDLYCNINGVPLLLILPTYSFLKGLAAQLVLPFLRCRSCHGFRHQPSINRKCSDENAIIVEILTTHA